MLVHTRGIVFRSVKYGESSVICTIYTEQLGLQTYILNGVRKARARISPGLVQHAALLDLVVYHRPEKEINRVKEIQFAYPYKRLPFEVIRGSMSLFLLEVAQKSIRVSEPNTSLFEFLYQHFIQLDQLDAHWQNLHLHFLVHFTQQLGFWPGGTYQEGAFFDYKEGQYLPEMPTHSQHFSAEESEWLFLLQHLSLSEIHTLKLSRSTRQQLVEQLLRFYQYHIPNFSEIHTHQILRTILD